MPLTARRKCVSLVRELCGSNAPDSSSLLRARLRPPSVPPHATWRCCVPLAPGRRNRGGRVFSAQVWESLRVEETHPDGYLSWGRFNSNGPGCAKWVHDLRAGFNFTDPKLALPGDFLKIFFSSQIGAQERGHLVVFLGLEQLRGLPHIRFWSANKPGGYGVRTLPLSSIRHLIFTRVTHPERIALAPSLPVHDPWLAAMLTHDFSFPEVCRRCGIGRGR